jgi:hypothetical protein
MFCFVTGISAPVSSIEKKWLPGEKFIDNVNISTKSSETLIGAITFDILVSVTWPSTIDITDRISVDRFAFGLGLGYHLNIIDKLFSPGLYFDFGFGGPIIIFENDSSETAVAYDSYGSVGLRAYNLFTVNSFGIKPFFGFSFIGNAEIKENDEIVHERFGLWSWVAGVMLTYKYCGIEYAFCMPDFNNIIPFPYKYYYRISLLLHLL